MCSPSASYNPHCVSTAVTASGHCTSDRDRARIWEGRHSWKRRASGPLHDFIKESSFAVAIMLSLRHSRSFYSQNNLMDNDTGQCQDLQHQQEFLEIFKHFFPHSITTSSSILSSFSGHVVKYLELFPFDWITVSKERWHSSDNLDFKRSN